MSAIRGLHAAVGDSEQPQWPCQFCGKHIDCCSCYFRASDVMVTIRKLKVAVPRWIPVTERLPETYDDVLGGHMHEDGSFTYRIAYRQFGTSLMRFYDKHDQMLGVTHWMPLPSPPSGGNP